ncbi:Cell division trigger factor [Rubellimicrobium mesophilum DSM 19309]|uniref:Trigger factor n=1 Tax=Rubellimicrobium mesophilum DSM 19309 TaxID=442562 RepID=A0A017HRU2_9RHOB|nr:trigger factor [Rubellimicrobium mesophilum]EYD77076.1 Cell division trigger factor [Rubellimicrobium mesophilum DSM 19309]
MQVTETLNEGLKRGYTVTVTAQELDEKVQSKLAEVQPQVAMKGFRKGKVPMALLRKQHGPRLMGEAMQETIDGAVSSHLESTGDRPAMQPSVKMTNEAWKEGDDVTVEVSYEKLPEVPEMDLSSLSLTRLRVAPEEASVDEALTQLADTAKSYEDKDGAAENGDQVVIDFVGKVDGEAFEGGSATDYPLVLGSNSFIPGFEDQLVGVKAGEEKDVDVTFPEEYGAKHLAGKAAVFTCTVKAVKAPKAAEIDDELATRFGAENLDDLRRQVRERLEQEYSGAARAVAKRALLDELDKRVDFDLPESLVKAEADQIAHQLWHEEHPHEHGHDHDHVEPTEDHLRLARRRVKLGLLLADLGQRAEVKVTDSELTQAVLQQARQYRGQERQFFEYVQNNPAARQQIQAPIFEDKVIDHIFGAAQVEEKEVSKDDLQAAVEKLDEE